MDKEFFDLRYQGFALGNQDTLEALTKALTAGSGVDAGAFTGGRAMIPESLDTTLVNVLWDQDEAKLFKALKKTPVKSPVHQFTRRTGVGDNDGAWVAEGGTSFEKDQTIERMNVTMKYLQTLRKVTLQATLSNMIEDAVSSEKMAGTLWIIKQIERILFDGNSTIVAEEPDGIRKLIWGKKSTDPENVIDVHGKDATSVNFEDAILEGCRVIRQKYGLATDMYMSLIVMQDFQKLLRDRLRFPAGPSGTILPMMVFDHYPTPFGKPALIDNLFILERGIPVTSSLTEKPSQPTIGTPLTPADAASNFKAGDDGAYFYKIAAVSKYGQSAISAASASVAVAVGDKVTFIITDGATAGTGFYIFRTKKGAANDTAYYLCNWIPWVVSGGTYSVDYNDWMPGCSDVFLMNLGPMYDAVEWEQFLPMMKYDLFPTNAAVYPFLMLLFGALAIKKTEQQVVIRNVAPSSLGWY